MNPRHGSTKVILATALLAVGCASAPVSTPRADAPEYLYVWGSVHDTTPPADARAMRPGQAVAMLTIDLREASATRGQVTDVILADTAGRVAHHTEHSLAADGMLFANDFGTGTTHRFDLRTPGRPKLLGSFTTAGPLAYPHSFALLPNGNVLATYQWTGGFSKPPGGLAELRRDGSVVRTARAAVTGVDSTELHPYSLEVIPSLDRVVTTSTSMVSDVGVHVQVWRLSDLTLLHTVEIPPAPGHAAHGDTAAKHGEHHRFPGEPRVLADGRTVMFGTFLCGLYRLEGLSGPSPTLAFSHAFDGENCAVPVRIGSFWVQTVPDSRSLVAMDITDPAKVREVSRLAFPAPVAPHWLAADASGAHLVMVTGSWTDPRVHFASFDPRTGGLAVHPMLRSVSVARVRLPSGEVVLIEPHGSVFSRR